MRILLAGAAAAAFAFAATPAFAQYGGSPAEQVDGAPDEAQFAPAPEDEADEPAFAEDDAGLAAAGAVPEECAWSDTPQPLNSRPLCARQPARRLNGKDRDRGIRVKKNAPAKGDGRGALRNPVRRYTTGRTRKLVVPMFRRESLTAS